MLSPLYGQLSPLRVPTAIVKGISPADISGLQLWLDATTGLYDATSGGNSVTSDGVAIGRWEDQSGNGNHGTQSVVNDQPLYRTGIPAVDFDGANDSINCGQPASLDITGNGTILFWVYMDSVTDFDGFVSKAIKDTTSIVSGSQYHIEAYQGRFRTIITGNDLRNGTQQTGTCPTISTGVWQQFAFSWDSSLLKQYKNGLFAASRSQSGSPQTKAYDLFIGKRDRLTTSAIDGRIAEVLIYSEALSEEDITTLFDISKSNFGL